MKHPLDPLSPAELTSVCDVLRTEGLIGGHRLLTMLQLEEPAKVAVRAWRPGDTLRRVARATLWDSNEHTVHIALVAVGGGVLDVQEAPGALASILALDCQRARDAVRKDERFLAALARRGILDIDSVHVEAWSFGSEVPAGIDSTRRLVWTPLWLRPEPDSNVYAHPIEGLRTIVDLDSCEVLRVEEDEDPPPIPLTPGPYRADQTHADVRLRDLAIVQKDGPSFTVDGWAVSWERWRLRVGFDQREGLVLHDVRFVDEGRERIVAYRMSIAELVIPYGDRAPGAQRKQAFDTGEFSLGNFTNSLTLGCDCLGEIVYLDVAVADALGNVQEIPQAICMHEEDHGILWKHTDQSDHVEVRRSRRFVVSSIVTVNNYEYGYFWYLYQDGSIEFEAKLTGIVLTTAGQPGAPAPSATEIEPGLLAPYHQHIFCARLDLDVDGGPNTLVEVDSEPLPPGPLNPEGSSYTTRQTVLARESAAQREVNSFTGRYWKLVNRQATGHLGGPVGYKLVPGAVTWPMALPESVIGRRAAFMYHHLWATPNRRNERYPAGEFPYQHAGGAGLPEWTAQDRPLEDTDVVLWHVFGTNHIPRSEDWPVMAVERTGFMLKPVGFFRRNPGIEVAPPGAHCH
ncbi:MAG: primary-amine oxidase [Actinobacteria bacterium]|nr:primary-amine oxidase [Actinomycetota bacterium]